MVNDVIPLLVLLASVVAISAIVIYVNKEAERLTKEKERLTRKIAAELYCLRIPVAEVLHNDNYNEAIFKEKQIRELLYRLGYDVGDVTNTLTNTEIIEACEIARPESLGIVFMEENTLDQEE